MNEYDQGSAYENYDSNDQLSPYELLMQMQSWNKSIFLRIEDAEKEWRTQLSIVNGEIRQEVEDVQEELSTSLSTTAAGIRAEMVDNKNSLTNQITATAEGIRASMVDADNKLSSQITTTAAGINATISDTRQNLQTQITATANGLASKVDGKDFNGQKVASLITQDANAINLIATKLNLSGYVTFSSLGPYGNTVIDGSRIQTGYIAADRLDAQAILAKVIQAGGISADYVKAGQLVGMSISGSIIVSDSGYARVTLANGSVTATSSFMNTTARMDGSFVATDSYGGMAELYPDRLTVQSGGSRLTVTSSQIGSNSTVRFQGYYDFSGASVTGLNTNVQQAVEAKWLTGNTGVWWGPNDFAQTRTQGLGFGFSSASALLYVSMNGVDRGSVKIT